tara:strand:+ start:273 stop:497 length:225 start_codon:yes stop_codon:yes gene_type:complete
MNKRLKYFLAFLLVFTGLMMAINEILRYFFELDGIANTLITALITVGISPRLHPAKEGDGYIFKWSWFTKPIEI